MKVRRAVFPVAGRGTRMLPATKALPKVLLPVVDRPLIQLGIEEVVRSGVDQIVLVTASGQEAIEDHFDAAPLLEATLAAEKKEDLLNVVRQAAELATVMSVRQRAPRGLADAVLAAAPLVGDEPFMVVLPDDLIRSEVPCSRQLLDVAAEHTAGVIALQSVPREESGLYGIVETEPLGAGLHRIIDLVEKPDPAKAPSTLAIIGRYVLPPGVFSLIEQTPPGYGGEIQLPDALRLLLEDQPLYGYEFQGHRYDCGQLLGYLQATVSMALDRPDIGEDFAIFLQEILASASADQPAETLKSTRGRAGSLIEGREPA
ncbi:MAG: UTP--glucose-1-phosphate uridylyltransferase [Dehalococcoidia bacterium]|nr:UTP--glucose-1-phosphate uridylyltransferase [Dehalococcoidia bacterium]